jgi:hypothetical protein
MATLEAATVVVVEVDMAVEVETVCPTLVLVCKSKTGVSHQFFELLDCRILTAWCRHEHLT